MAGAEYGSMIQDETGADFAMRFCLDWHNKRLRVDDCRGNPASILGRVNELANHHRFTKAFIKAREVDWQLFLSEGCMLEGIYKGYFLGEDAFCMALYFDVERRTSDDWLEEDRILGQVQRLPAKQERPEVPDGFTLRHAGETDAGRLSALYGGIFHTYPTPMADPEYVRKVLREGTVFYVIEQADSLVSAASAEIDGQYRNAEITDCATLPDYRKHGLMRLLIGALEEELVARNIRCAYSLSRALSFGMNAALRQLGYRYGGRLTKNCSIYTKFEDMNLWNKTL